MTNLHNTSHDISCPHCQSKNIESGERYFAAPISWRIKKWVYLSIAIIFIFPFLVAVKQRILWGATINAIILLTSTFLFAKNSSKIEKLEKGTSRAAYRCLDCKKFW